MKFNILGFNGNVFTKWCQTDSKKEIARIISVLIVSKDAEKFVLTDNKGIEAFVQELAKSGPYLTYDHIRHEYGMYFNEKGEFVKASK